MQSIIQTRLEEKLKTFQFNLSKKYPKEKFNRWIYTSAMQKAIRRGHSEIAQHLGGIISNLIPPYFWYRISVIAMEDICLGNIPAVQETLFLSSNKEFRQDMGSQKCAAYILDRLASGGKDRSACDSVVIAGNGNEFKNRRNKLADLSKKELQAILLDEEAEYAARVIAARYLAGTKAGAYKERKGDWSAVLAANEKMNLPDDILWIVQKAFERKAEGMPCAFGLAYRCFYPKNPKFIPDEITHHEMFGNIPSYAHDMHTIPGLSALSYFGKNCEPMRRYIEAIKPHDVTKALGAILFRVDSDLLDNRIQLSDKGYLRHAAGYAFGEKFGIPRTRFWEGVQIMQDNFGEFAKARTRFF